MTGERLQAVLSRMRDGQSGGMSGWRVAELRRLPLSILQRLAVVFDTVEKTGTWPSTLERALVPFILKTTGRSADDLRPISVVSAVYRLWAAARLPDVNAWQEKWITENQHGARPGHSTEDVYWQIALLIEQATLTGTPLYCFTIDYRKCFDLVMQKILLNVVEKLGLCPEISRPLRTMYRNLRRRFKFDGAVYEFEAVWDHSMGENRFFVKFCKIRKNASFY